jgi:outer membrane lipoprotein-sorting protein
MKKYRPVILFLSLPLLFLSACIFMGPAIRGEGEVTKETRKITGFEKIEVSRETKTEIRQVRVSEQSQFQLMVLLNTAAGPRDFPQGN